ncbi:major facilitator superfamily transporter [Diplocarpon rosae]|nr:major facilitator superfamily transporter [Diplocarpon rosae]
MSPINYGDSVPQSDQASHLNRHQGPESIRSVSQVYEQPSINYVRTNTSTQDAHVPHYSSFVEVPDEIYDRLSLSRKLVIVALLSYCSFLAPISSTTILAAIPEVAATYDSTGTVISLSSALYMVFMGVSPCFWGPLSQICLLTAALFCTCSLGTALAPNLAAYFVFRILTAFEGTSFLIVGASCIGDIYRPTERATAMGWFLSGTLIGPAFGPFIGGIIVTFKSWRVIFYLQSALAGVALIGAYFLLPETAHHKKADDLVGLPLQARAKVLVSMLDPWRVVRLYKYPNLIMVSLASASLVWNMYSLLTPIRYILNPRFDLNSPIESGLFYLAPGCGYILGTFFGGRYADHITVTWKVKRGDTRIPEDRLRSALPFMGVAIPFCILIYGWSIEKRFGGIALPVIMMFCQGVAQLFCFPSLNTYCLDVMQSHSAEVIAGNYMIRYLFAALGSGTVLPAVEKIGVGWFSTISAGFLVGSSLATYAAVRWGVVWRESVDEKRRARRREKGMAVGDEVEKKVVTAKGQEKDVV